MVSSVALVLIASGPSVYAQGMTTALVIDSMPGDYVGGGRQYSYTPADAPFTIQRQGSNGIAVSVISPGFSIVWTARFAARRGELLQAGSYYGNRFTGSPLAGLDVGGEGRGCNRVVGRFDVLEIVYAPDGTVTSFAADFEQHCEFRDAALFGAVRYNSSVSSTVPFGGIRGNSVTLVPGDHGTISGPGLQCGQGSALCGAAFAAPVDVALVATAAHGYLFAGWTGSCSGDAATTLRVNTVATCAARFEPVESTSARTVITLDSLAGDYTGGGKRRSYAASTAFITATPFGQGQIALEITARDDQEWQFAHWTIRVLAPTGESLQVGEYNGAKRFAGGVTPEVSVIRTGISVCPAVQGRFVIHDIALADDFTVARLSADIEQHCGNTDAAIFVAIRYNAAGSAVPFGGEYPRYGFTAIPPQHGTITAAGVNCGSGGMACHVDYAAPLTLEIRAIPDAGYVFAGWAGDCRGRAAATVRIFGRRTCEAIFQPVAPTLPRTSVNVERETDALSLPAPASATVGTESTVRWTIGSALVFELLSAAPDGTPTVSRFSFGPPPGETVQIGKTYLALRDQSLGTAAMDVGSGCNSSIGRFVVKELTLSAAGAVQSFALDFEEHCNGADPAVYGSFRYKSTVDATLFDGPFPAYAVRVARPEDGSVSGGGLDCGPVHATCRIDFATPQDVAIIATPMPGFVFGGWTGACHGGAATTVRANMLKDCGVTFLPDVPVEPRTQLAFTGRPGDDAVNGRAEVFSSGNAKWQIIGGTAGNGVGIDVTALGAQGPERWKFSFSGNPGGQLGPGRYFVSSTSDWISATIKVTLETKLCWADSGDFTVREIRADAFGAFNRLWIDFTAHCGFSSPTVIIGSLKFNSILEMGALSIDRASLMFGASIAPGGAVLAQTPAQLVRVTKKGDAAVAWHATTTAPWLSVSPASGTGSAVLSVSVSPAHAAAAVSNAQVLVSDSAGEQAGTVAVTLTRTQSVVAGVPYGSFDTPIESSTPLRGSVAVTGWAIDDVAIDEVQIWRDPHPSESTLVFNGPGPQRGKVFIGIATRVEGARPDIESLFSAPDSATAGWGYLMLTRGMIWDGQGAFRLYAIAIDREGHIVELGRKTVTIENATATQPFGAIDSPAPGETVSGVYPVTGWALTPNAGASIPANAVQIVIDGVPLSHVLTTGARSDITAWFATFDASQAGRGAFVDTRTLSDGIHTISWLVTDSTGKADGIGSRYFRVANGVVSPIEKRN